LYHEDFRGEVQLWHIYLWSLSLSVSDLVARRGPTDVSQVARLKVRPRTLRARALRVELKSPIGRKEMSSTAVRIEAFAEDLYTLRQTKIPLPSLQPGVY
jgi:hypothetical protein